MKLSCTASSHMRKKVRTDDNLYGSDAAEDGIWNLEDKEACWEVCASRRCREYKSQRSQN